MRETIECLRPILAGDARRLQPAGTSAVTASGCGSAQPETRIAVGAFGPAMTRVAAQHADEVVLNLVPPPRVAEVRAAIDAEAAAAGRTRAAPDGMGARRASTPVMARDCQLAAQLAVYLGPPGYGEMFCALGFRRPRPARPRRHAPTRTGGLRPRRAARSGVRSGLRRPRSPPGCRPTTRPAPTASRSCPRRPRTLPAERH